MKSESMEEVLSNLIGEVKNSAPIDSKIDKAMIELTETLSKTAQAVGRQAEQCSDPVLIWTGIANGIVSFKNILVENGIGLEHALEMVDTILKIGKA